MPNIINADNGVVSGFAGVRTTADGTGNLALQSNGVTLMTLATNNTVTISGTTSQTGNASFSNAAVFSGATSGTIAIIANATAGTNTLTLPAATGTVLSTTSTGVCRAWVIFSGSTIIGQYNVSSVTVNSTGNFTINFTSNLPSANYAVIASCDQGSDAIRFTGLTSGSRTVSSCGLFAAYSISGSITASNLGNISVAFFG